MSEHDDGAEAVSANRPIRDGTSVLDVVSAMFGALSKVGETAFRIAEMTLVLFVFHYLSRTDPPLVPTWVPSVLFFFTLAFIADRAISLTRFLWKEARVQVARTGEPMHEVIGQFALVVMFLGLYAWMIPAFVAAETNLGIIEAILGEYPNRLADAVAGK